MNFILKCNLLTRKKIVVLTIALTTIYIFNKFHQFTNSINPPIPSIHQFTDSTNEKYLPEEINFPIAYGISVYRDVEQFGNLFRAIYRPFNLYCIHVDLKSDIIVHNFVRELTTKFENVILPRKFINVVHGKFSVLESELLCMEALYQHQSIKWKYFINLTGQEWPLKVNLELVRILKELNGANLIEKIEINPERVPNNIGPPPNGIKLWKGAVHIIVVREFVEFALYNKQALILLDYLKKTLIPDETYFSTLNHDHSLKAPGGYSGDLLRDPVKYPFINRYKLWRGESVCHGTFVRDLCIFSMKDVPGMIDCTNKKLFANKFVLGMNDNVLKYMEKWFYNRTKMVYGNVSKNLCNDLTYYSQLTIVNNHYS